MRTRGTDGAEEDGIVLFQALKTTIWDVLSEPLVCLGAPVVVLKAKVERSIGFGQGFENLNTGIDHLWSNAVGGDTGDAVVGASGAWRHVVVVSVVVVSLL